MTNVEFLKKLIQYDPTSIQKKIRFKRCNKVLKRTKKNDIILHFIYISLIQFYYIVLPKEDIQKRASTPIKHMHDWLTISLELRQQSVLARQRKPEIFSLPTDHDLDSRHDETEDDEDNIEDDHVDDEIVNDDHAVDTEETNKDT